MARQTAFMTATDQARAKVSRYRACQVSGDRAVSALREGPFQNMSTRKPWLPS